MTRVLSLFILISLSLTAYSQQPLIDSLQRLNAITTAVPLLLITPDARAAGLGDIGVSTSPDANSVRWNPAKMAFSEKKAEASVSYTPWMRNLVSDIDMSYLSGYRKLDDRQAISMSILYFTLGNIVFTDNAGNVIGNFTPRETTVDIAYARQLSSRFAGGIAARYIRSNLSGGTTVGGASTNPGWSIAADVAGYYTNDDLTVGDNDATLNIGLNISNIGNKMSYSNANEKDFIPTNMRLGSTFSLRPDQYNVISFSAEFNKLLVPTPPLRDPVTGQIVAGKDDNVAVATGVFQSFGDAPGGFKEEIREINPSLGIEYIYAEQFAVRAGYFYEHPTKGNRKYFSVGAGLKFKAFGLDVAYLIASQPTNPLRNTLRFSLLFDFDGFKSQTPAS